MRCIVAMHFAKRSQAVVAGMRSRLPHKRDANHAEIAQTFESLGCTVADTSALGDDFPDMVVGIAGVNLMVEAKSDGGRLSPGQHGFRERWRGQYDVVNSPDEAVELVQGVRRGLRFR